MTTLHGQNSKKNGVDDQVLAQMQQRLESTGLYAPDVAHQYAILHGAFYDTMAARMGISAADLLQEIPLPVIATPDKAGPGPAPSKTTVAPVTKKSSSKSMPFEIEMEGNKTAVAKVGSRVVGRAHAWKDSREKFVIMNTEVLEKYRRRGVASAMYKAIEEATGEQLTPAVSLSDDAFGLWKSFRPEAVAKDLRHWKEQIIGARAMWKNLPGKIIKASGGTATFEYDQAQPNGTQSTILRDQLNAALVAAGSPEIDFESKKPAAQIGEFNVPVSNFDNWFVGSKAVQPNGAPLILYHGTGADTGDTFLPGTYFTPRPDVAEIYAKAPTRQVEGAGPNVSPVFVSIKNPYIHDDQAVGDNLSHSVLGKRGSLEKVREKLIADGYDGIILKNFHDLGGFQDQYVIFESSQVKSAIGNDGGYNPKDSNVLHQPAWHGSPHEFDQFSLDKIGTGEGAKSFGYGLYFTETEAVAVGYANMPHFKKAKVENPQVIQGMGPGARGLLDRIEKLGSVIGAQDEAKELLESMRSTGSFPSVQVDLADEIDLVNEFGKKLELTPTGIKSNLYKVEITEGYVANFLNWDRALSKQSAEVRKVLAHLAPDHYAEDSDDYDASETGQTIYHRLSSIFGGDKGASEALSAAGIKGIKYLDGNSRDEGSGTNNMVVFDEAIVTITHKDGEEIGPSERDVFMQSPSHEVQPGVKILYRGTNDSGEKIKGGIAEGALFATPHEDVARSYAGSGGVIERIGLLPDAKILVEGTREFAKLTGRRPGKLLNTMRAGENLKTASDDAVEKARAVGFDGVEFNSFRDLGTVILNAEKVIRNYTPPEEVAAAKDAFSDWFGSSKVVSGQGKPMVVYHGTGNLENLERFDPNFAGQGTDQIGSGFYFTTDANDASGYADTFKNSRDGNQKIGGANSPGVAPVYLSIKKPIHVKGQSLNDTDVVLSHKQVVEIIKRAPGIRDVDESPLGNHVDIWSAGGVSEKMISDVAKLYSGKLMVALEGDMFRENSEAYRKALHEVLGYDGVVKDFGDGRKHYVAWFPEQIKSAIGNRGTYAPNDPSILHQQRGNRGFYNPRTVEIGLLKDADPSTFIHESAHFFLDSMSRLAALPQTPQDIRDDFDILLRWFSVDGSDQQERLRTWLAMDLNGQREGHERFARGFESYAAAGQAPSPELEGMFAQFSEWLSQVCQSMDLPAEVQGAMGRLLAAANDDEMNPEEEILLRERV